MDDQVKISAAHLQELIARLTDRRIAVEKELGALGAERKGHQDIFKHCRGFERSFQVMLNEANVAFKIRAVVEGNLPETLRKIPIEKRFNKNYTQQICREADGYQPHLVSPEKGIKRLVAEAMKLTNEHVHRFVDEIHLVLMETVREAARRAVLSDSDITDKKIAKDLDFLRLKGFENAVILAASQALEDWRVEAHRIAEAMVQMECDYVTPTFFRDLEKQWQEEAAANMIYEGGNGGINNSPGLEHSRDRLDALAAGEVSVADGDGDDSDTESNAEQQQQQHLQQQQLSSRASPSSSSSAPAARAMQQRADLKAGWLEKRAGDTSNLSALPVEAWRWQKRWFVLAMEAGLLYYFSSPDDVSKQPKIAINMRNCVVEDFQPEGAGMPTRRSTQKIEGHAGAVSLLIRISHKNPSLPVAKAHHHIILRATDAADKYDWLARLRHATEPGAGVGRGPKISGNSTQYLNAAASSSGGGGQPLSTAATTPRSSLSLGGTGGGDSNERGLFGRTLNKVTDQFKNMTGIGSSKLGDVMAVGSIEDIDAYYEKLGIFCGLYARDVFNRMSKTVPKAIILCQVIRSRDKLLDQLFNYLSSLSTKEVEFMLQEDPVLSKRRVAAQQASKDMTDAAEEVRKIQERRASGSAGKKEEESISVRALLLAGAFPLVPKDRVPQGIDPGSLYGEYTPVTLVAGPDAKKQLAKAIGNAPNANAANEASNGTAGGDDDASRLSGGDVGDDKNVGSPQRSPGASSSSSAAAAAAAKPRRQPPPPPPK